MADEVVIVGSFTLGGTLGGVALGFAGQWFLEQRRDTKAGRIAVSAVFYELSLLAAALKSAVKDEEQTREDIRAPMWDRHGPELINHLPQAFVSVLQLQYDQLPKMANLYTQAIAGVEENRWQPISVAMLAWAFRADRARELLNEWKRRRRPFWRRSIIQRSEGASQVWDEVKSSGDLRVQIETIRSDVQSHATCRLRSDGYDVDDEGKLKVLAEQEVKAKR